MRKQIDWKTIWREKQGLCILYGAECLILLCLLVGLLFWRGQGHLFSYPSAGEAEEHLALSAGVYRVQVNYSQTGEGASSVKLTDAEGRYKYLFVNEIPLQGGEEQEKTFTFLLLFPSEDIALRIFPGENVNLQLQSVTVEKTARGAFLILFAAAALFLVLDTGLYCREQMRGRTDWRERRRTFWALAGIVTLVSVPLLVDYCLSGGELIYHLQRIEYVKDSLAAGHYPMAAPEGSGSAFYGSALLVFPALLRIVGFPVQDVWRFFLFVLNVVTAWTAYVCFRRIFASRTVGLVGSMLYTWAPYRLYDLYGRAQLGESMALCFLPLVCLGLYLLLAESPEKSEADHKSRFLGLCRPWVLLTIGFTGLNWSYFVSFEVMVGAFVLLCLPFVKKISRKDCLKELAKTALAVLLLNAGGFLRVLRHFVSEAPYYAADAMVQHRGMYFAQYLTIFFRSGESVRISEAGLVDAAPRGIGFAVTCMMLLYLWIRFSGRYSGSSPRERFGAVTAVVGVLLMFLSTGSFPWDRLRSIHWTLDKVISDLQTPACLVPAVTLCFVFTACLALWQVMRREREGVGLAVLLAAVLIAFSTTQFLIGDTLRSKAPLRIYNGEAIETVQAEADTSL